MDNLRNKFKNINDYIENSEPFQFYTISSNLVGSARIIEMLYHNGNNNFDYTKDKIEHNLCYHIKNINGVKKYLVIETLRKESVLKNV
jgi:hypothetical protein